MEIKEIKNTIKTLGADIREARKNFKNSQRHDGYTEHKYRTELEINISKYRSLHIASGLIRGKEYKQIERKTRKGNEPDWKKIFQLIEDFGNGGTK